MLQCIWPSTSYNHVSFHLDLLKYIGSYLFVYIHLYLSFSDIAAHCRYLILLFHLMCTVKSITIVTDYLWYFCRSNPSMQMHEECVRTMRAVVRRNPTASSAPLLHLFPPRLSPSVSRSRPSAKTSHQPRILQSLRSRDRDLPYPVSVETKPLQ